MIIRRMWFALLFLTSGWTFLSCSNSTAVAVDDAWMATPYQSVIWMAMPDDHELENMWELRLEDLVLRRCRAYFGAAMKFTMSAVPQRILESAIVSTEDVSMPMIGPPEDEVWQNDKVFLVIVRHQQRGLRLEAREFDCRTRRWGSPYTVEDISAQRLDIEVSNALFRVFRCVGRIASHEKHSAILEMRAGLLAELSQAHTIPPPGGILYPVLRLVDRRGERESDSAQPIPWTLLRVEPRREDREAVENIATAKVRCRIDSGLGSPFRARTMKRVERLALFVTPTYSETVIELRTATQPARPLLGYEIHARLPDNESWQFVGRSSWDGNVVIPRDEHPYKIYYVKHGDTLLARLPIAAGLEPRIRIELPDHRERLLAEAFVNRVEDQVLDIVLRREVIASKLRQRLSREVVTEADIAAANKMLEEIRQINRSQPLIAMIEQHEATFGSDQRSVQRRIDIMFANLRKAIRETISESYVSELKNTIDMAKLRDPSPQR